MRSKYGATVGYLLVITGLSASPPEIAHAIDRSDARTLELQRDLRSVRSRVERAPRASSFDLENLQRRLHDQRIAAPGDPRLQALEIELRRLRARADRNAGRPGVAAAPARASPLAAPAPIDRPYLSGGHTAAAVTPARPSFGQRLIAVQRSLAASEARLAQGDTASAARLLEAARRDLAMLRGSFDRAVADDPNITALEAQIRALKEQPAGR